MVQSPIVFSASGEPLFNKVAQVLGCFIAALGLMGIVGYVFNYPILLTVFHGTPPIAVLTASSFIFLGVAVLTVLDTQPYDGKPQWLWPLRWISVLMPGFIGLLCVNHYLNLAGYDVLNFVLLRREGAVIPTIMTSSRIFLSSVGLILFLMWRNRVPVVVYGIGAIGLYLVYTSLMAFSGHALHLPLLYDYMISVPASAGLMAMGIAMLTCTLSHSGLMLPLFSTESKSRWLAFLALFLSVVVLAYGIGMIAITAGYMQLELMPQKIAYLYVGAEFASVLVAMMIGIIAMRAVQYRNESLHHVRMEKKITRLLKRSEEHLRRLVDSNIVGIFCWRITGEVTEANDAFLNTMGYSRQELYQGAINWRASTPPEYKKKQEETLKVLAQEKAVQPYKKQHYRKDGSRVDVLAAFAMFEDSQDSGIGIMLDISELEQMREELRMQLHLIRAITDNTPDVMAVLDAEGRVTFWNPAAEALTGYRFEELTGKVLHEVVHYIYPNGQDFPIDACPLYQTLGRHEGFRNQETFWIHKDGGFVPIRWTVSPLKTDVGLSGVVLEAQDISNEKRYQQEAENIRYALNVATIVDITDPDGNILFVNDTFCKITKYTAQELVGQNMRILNSGYHSSEFFKNLKETIRQGQIWKGEIRNKAKDGTICWMNTTIVPFLNDMGKPNQYICIRHDITEQKKLEQLLLGREEDLRYENKKLDQFAMFASQDLKTPLRKVRQLVDSLEKLFPGKLDSQSADFMKRIQNSVSEMERGISDMLELSKSKKEMITIVPVKLNEVVDEVLIQLQDVIDEKQALVEVGQLCMVQGDKVQLQSLFKNLIENALNFQHSENQPIISITSEETSRNYCEIRITDNGIGFDESNLAQIFLPFARLHGKSEYPGTGVGLAICKQIIERHQGSITATSKPGQGSTFIVRLPLRVELVKSSTLQSLQQLVPTFPEKES